jgi:hypothetical protein
MFKPKFSAADVDKLLRFYWPTQSERMQRIERDLESRAPQVRQKQYLTRDEFRLACSWTAIRAVGQYKTNTEAGVREQTARAFGAESEAQHLSVLMELNGVSYTTASIILHFFHRNTYPILSEPSLWSLSVEKISYSLDFWLEYTHFFRDLVKEWKISPRNLDRALWQYHYEKHAREVPYSDDD